MRSQTRLALVVSIALCWPWEQLLRLTLQYNHQVAEGCRLPWHCPCTEQRPQMYHYLLQQQQRKRAGSSGPINISQLQKRREAIINTQDDIQSRAYQMKQATKTLLDSFITDRFGDKAHAKNLEICVRNRTRDCLAEFLAECRLDHLPHINEIDIVNLQHWNQPSYQQNHHASANKNAAMVPQIQNLLSRLAEYVQEAYRDEQHIVPDQRHSLAQNMTHIQYNGIYYILCYLRLLADQPNPNATGSNIMLYTCKNLRSDARTHNRNYMIFFVLDKLLEKIGSLRLANYKATQKFNRQIRASIPEDSSQWNYDY